MQQAASSVVANLRRKSPRVTQAVDCQRNRQACSTNTTGIKPRSITTDGGSDLCYSVNINSTPVKSLHLQDGRFAGVFGKIFTVYINPLKSKLVYIIFKNPVRTSKRTPHFTITKLNWLTLFNPLKSKLLYIIFKNPVRTSKRTPHFTITKINWLTLFKFNPLKSKLL
jgi:hypothetical protein